VCEYCRLFKRSTKVVRKDRKEKLMKEDVGYTQGLENNLRESVWIKRGRNKDRPSDWVRQINITETQNFQRRKGEPSAI